MLRGTRGEPLISTEEPLATTEAMKVEVEREGQPFALAFKPTSGNKKGQAFRRKPGLSDEACKKLALRK
jgi:hypothetical protein